MADAELSHAPAPAPAPSSTERTSLDMLLLALRCAAASVLATVAAQALGLRYPIYAMVAAIIVSDESMSAMKAQGVQRLIGTALGAAVGALVSVALGHTLAGIAVVVLMMIFVCHRIGLRDAAKLAAYVAGIVVLDHSDSPWSYAVDRFIETGIGIAAAYAIGALFWFAARRRSA